MNKKKNLIAGIVLICLVAMYISLYFDVLKPKTTVSPAEDYENEPIFTCELNEIASIHISNSEENFTFEKIKDEWVCVEKPEIELEQNAVSYAAMDYISLVPDRVIEENASDLDQYGLNDPRGSISLLMKDGTETTFLLGNDAQNGKSYFAIKDHHSVYLVGTMISSTILNSLTAFRKTTLFSLAEESVKDVYFQIGDNSYRINRVKQSQWEMTEPFPREVYGPQFAEFFLTPALSMQINAYYDEMKAEECGLNNPTYKLQISSGDETDILLIGDSNEAGIYYAMWESKGQIFGILKDSLSFFETSPLSYIMTYVYLPNIDTVKSFVGTVQGKEFSMVLERKDENIEYILDGEKVESDVWKNKFQALLTADIVGFVEKAEINGEPTVSYTAKLVDGTETKIAFYPMDERTYVVTYNGKVSFSVNKNTVDSLIENFNTAG